MNRKEKYIGVQPGYTLIVCHQKMVGVSASRLIMMLDHTIELKLKALVSGLSEGLFITCHETSANEEHCVWLLSWGWTSKLVYNFNTNIILSSNWVCLVKIQHHCYRFEYKVEWVALWWKESVIALCCCSPHIVVAINYIYIHSIFMLWIFKAKYHFLRRGETFTLFYFFLFIFFAGNLMFFFFKE